MEDHTAPTPVSVDPVVRSARRTARYTGFIALFTLLYTVIMGFYTNATYSLLAEQQNSNQFSERTFYIAQRPWLTVAHFVQPFVPNDIQETIPIPYIILNSGRSLAYDVSISTETFIDNISQGTEDILVKVISSQREFLRWYYIRNPQYSIVKEGAKPVHIVVRIEYTDSQKMRHHTTEKVTIFNNGINAISTTEEAD